MRGRADERALRRYSDLYSYDHIYIHHVRFGMLIILYRIVRITVTLKELTLTSLFSNGETINYVFVSVVVRLYAIKATIQQIIEVIQGRMFIIILQQVM